MKSLAIVALFAGLLVAVDAMVYLEVSRPSHHEFTIPVSFRPKTFGLRSGAVITRYCLVYISTTDSCFNGAGVPVPAELRGK